MRLDRGVAIAVLLLSSVARAESPADLRLHKFPTITPSSLSMRLAAVADDDVPSTEKAEDTEDAEDVDAELPIDPDVGEDALELEIEAGLRERIRASDVLGQRRSLDEKVVLQVSLGIGIDGGQPAPGPNEDEPPLLASGAPLDETNSYARLRSYGFGDLVIGTNGLATSSLRSYFATGFRFRNKPGRPSTAIPSVYDGAFGSFIVRSAWVDVEEVFESRALRPLYMRVGRQYKYGAAVAHFTGITVGWKARGVSVSSFAGTRAQPYEFNIEEASGGSAAITGGDVTVDLYELRRIPVVLSASALEFDDRSHWGGSAALRFGRNALLRARLRTLDGSLAQEAVRLRARLTDVTTISAEIDNRHSKDWVYDLLLVKPETSRTDARSYLNLGAPRARVRSAVRAGTVLLRNIDLLASAAGALEYANEDKFPPTATRTSYIEAGSAVEVQARRGFRIGVSGTGRLYRRPFQGAAIDAPDIADELKVDNSDTGETSFVEGGITLRYTLGARIFSATGELYGRRFRFQSPHNEDETPIADFRSGGRFAIDGWASKGVRFRLSYDLSLTSIRYAPELAGVKTLRAMVEGTF